MTAAITDEYTRFFRVFTKVSKAIHSGENTDEILEQIVRNIAELFHAKGCIFWIVDEGQGSITRKISHGFSYRSLVEIDFKTLMKIFDQQGLDHVSIEDAIHDSRIPNLDRIGKKRVSSITALKFDIIRDIKGILAVYFTEKRQLSLRERESVTALGEQGAIALQKSLSFDEKMLTTLRQIVEGFTLALEAKDEQTHGHSVRVARLARAIAKELDLTESQVETVYHGALLHDIGKIGMNDDILNRLGILDKKEMDRIRQHPIIGERITAPLVFLSDVAPLIRHHHERWDGTGYPDGLRGKAIPLGARIVTVCDAFETMLAGRRYFEKMKIEDAIVNLQLSAGNHFDPEIVLKLFSLLEKHPQHAGTRAPCLRTLKIHKRNLQNSFSDRKASLFI